MPKTRKIKMPASALEDADVQFISLVSRPANRIPYRIMKAEDITNESQEPETESNLMLNLPTFMKRKIDTDPTGPVVAAIVIRKEDAESLIPQLKELGLIVDDTMEQKDVIVLKQADYDEDSVLPFKVNDDVLILVAGVKKQFEPFIESTDFNDNAQVSGFLPGLHMATEALFDTYRNILIDSRSQGEAVTAMKSAIDSYSSFVTNLAENLPQIAFKLEDIMAVAKEDAPAAEETPAVEETAPAAEATDTEAKKDDDTGEAAPAATEEVQTETAPVATETVAVKEAAPGDHEEGLDDKPAETKPTESAVKEDTEEKDPPDLAAMLASFKSEIMEGINGVQSELTAVKDTANSLKDRLDEVEEVAKSAETAARGTVQAGSDAIDQSLGTRNPVSKSDKDDEMWGGVLDGIVPGS